MPPEVDPITKAVREMDQRYRNVFASAEGQKVLGDILTKGHYGVTLDSENRDQVAEYNFALVIATRAGVLDSVYQKLGMIQKGE
jgi:uncharacterized protein with GYD domain